MRAVLRHWKSLLGFGMFFLLVFVSQKPRGMGGALFALVLLGLVGGCAAISALLAPTSDSRADTAHCTLVCSAWAYAVGYGQYWSSCEWFPLVDVVVLLLTCLYAQTRICGKMSPWRTAAHAAPLLSVIVVCEALGVLVRGFADDPKM